jgi:hypothetical protein
VAVKIIVPVGGIGGGGVQLSAILTSPLGGEKVNFTVGHGGGPFNELGRIDEKSSLPAGKGNPFPPYCQREA